MEVLRVGRQELGRPVVVVHKRKQNYYTIHAYFKSATVAGVSYINAPYKYILTNYILANFTGFMDPNLKLKYKIYNFKQSHSKFSACSQPSYCRKKGPLYILFISLCIFLNIYFVFVVFIK